MDGFWEGAKVGIVAGVIAGVIGGLSVLLLGLLMPARKCPDCGRILPKFRKPQSARQAMWGGCTCPDCGCEMDRAGRKVQA